MNEPRRPIFGFLWPRPDPLAPVGAAYTQVRAVRISSRGVIRVLVLSVGSALVTVVTGVALLAALESGLSIATVVGGSVAATGLFLLLRGWIVGTYVTDAQVIVETTFRRNAMSWSDVESLDDAVLPCPFLGLPFRVRARRIVVVMQTGRRARTHVYATSPDFWLRPEAFDIAVLRLGRWRSTG